MNSHRWRMEEVDGGPTVARGGWRGSTMEMNSIPWIPVLRYATPLPMNRTPVSTIALQHKSVSSVLRYTTPLPINKIPFRTWLVEHKAVSSIVRYARHRFHRLFRPSRLAPTRSVAS